MMHDETPSILVLTPVKNARHQVEAYFRRLLNISFPSSRISVGLLESDSADNSLEALDQACERFASAFANITLLSRNFGFHIPPGVPRWHPGIQLERRSVLARSRNHLLLHALDEQEWVLWLDVDVVHFPHDIIQRLLSYDKDIIAPHCVKQTGGPTFDVNSWRDHGRITLDQLRDGHELEPLDAVGGAMLLIRADCHRDGLIFPSFLYGQGNPKARWRTDLGLPETRGEIETEGLGLLAADMGLTCWGVPKLEVLHDSV